MTEVLPAMKHFILPADIPRFLTSISPAASAGERNVIACGWNWKKKKWTPSSCVTSTASVITFCTGPVHGPAGWCG